MQDGQLRQRQQLVSPASTKKNLKILSNLFTVDVSFYCHSLKCLVYSLFLIRLAQNIFFSVMNLVDLFKPDALERIVSLSLCDVAVFLVLVIVIIDTILSPNCNYGRRG